MAVLDHSPHTLSKNYFSNPLGWYVLSHSLSPIYVAQWYCWFAFKFQSCHQGGMLMNNTEEQQLDQLQLDNTPYNYPSFNPALPLPSAIPHRSNSLTPAMQEISRMLEETIPEEREEDILSRESFTTGRKKSSKFKQQMGRESVSSRGSSASSTRSVKR